MTASLSLGLLGGLAGAGLGNVLSKKFATPRGWRSLKACQPCHLHDRSVLRVYPVDDGENVAAFCGLNVVNRADREDIPVYHCSRHDIDHRSYDCPRCEAERRHEELLEQARESHEEVLRLASEIHEEATEAARESDYRRANPGDYKCPHCKYISLKRDASRCPICHGEPGPAYWSRVAAREEIAKAHEKEAKKGQARREKIAADKRALANEERRKWEAIEFHGHIFLVFLICVAILTVILLLKLLRWWGSAIPV